MAGLYRIWARRHYRVFTDTARCAQPASRSQGEEVGVKPTTAPIAVTVSCEAGRVVLEYHY